MSYSITPYSYRQAKRIGVEIRPSKTKGKKLDVYDDNKKIASIGHIDYPDYPHYIRSHGKEYANERKKLYHLRHKDGPKNSPAYLAKRLLW